MSDYFEALPAQISFILHLSQDFFLETTELYKIAQSNRKTSINLDMLKSLTNDMSPNIIGIKANMPNKIGATFWPVHVLNSSIFPWSNNKLDILPHPT